MTKSISTIALAALVALGTGGAATAATVVNGSFENVELTNGGNWQVFNSIDGWSTVSGSGIEIQTGPTLGYIDAQDGDKYVELDSHDNSAMKQAIYFEVGLYELSFWFSPRKKGSDAAAALSNVIDYSIGTLLNGTVTGPTAETPYDIWTNIKKTFTVKTAGSYDLVFAADGTENTYGGLIDNVSISAIPLPAGGMLLLTALGGLGLARRRKA